LVDITEHRELVVVEQVTIFSQAVSFPTSSSAIVVSDALYMDRWLSDDVVRPYRDDFVVTGVYEMDRWWLCRSYVENNGNRSSKSGGMKRTTGGGAFK